MIEFWRVILASTKYFGEQITFAPDNAMDGLAWRASDRADGKAFRCLFDIAIVALRLALDIVSGCVSAFISKRKWASYFLDNLYLSVETRRAALDQGYIRRQAHFVDMTSRLQVVKRIEYDRKAFKPANVELWVLDIGMMRFDLDPGVELSGGLFRNLIPVLSVCYHLTASTVPLIPYQCFRLLYMFMPE